MPEDEEDDECGIVFLAAAEIYIIETYEIGTVFTFCYFLPYSKANITYLSYRGD